ncbi:hypothetical protein KY290_025058 [Solanum tuberosum]|uniref:Uncharacterized protein n=1 Tax=Solanum tuberosum TaxID=4113 RepID=A0ABQ7USK6_SOLTU|nr:hypothetical protein KY284_023916 [Solanum tuberosum]KAH0754788.1 hypothetical protein KY290_025058 [Solanum tuberosum]
MMKFVKEMISSTSSNSNSNISSAQQRLRRIFKGALGALDGTLVHAVVLANQQIIWEGVAHDARVLTEIDLRHAINKEEKFNHGHAQLKNVIERAFGVLKEEGEHEEVLDETNGPGWTTADSQIMSNMREELALQLMQRRGNT